LAETVQEVVGFEGTIVFDDSKPDGAPRKKLDSSQIQEMGWKARTPLKDGIGVAYRDYLERHHA
jgi:GDP-L-fucose synthase